MQPGKGRKGKSFKQRLVLKSSLAKETISEFLGTFIMIVSISWILTQLCLSFSAGGGCFVFFKFVTRVIFSRQEHITSRLFWAIYWPQVRFPFTHFIYSQELVGVGEGESTTFFISEIYSDSELALIESQSIETFLID